MKAHASGRDIGEVNNRSPFIEWTSRSLCASAGMCSSFFLQARCSAHAHAWHASSNIYLIRVKLDNLLVSSKSRVAEHKHKH